MSSCNENDIIEDIALSRKLVSENIGIDMQHFAFPFGDNSVVLPEHIRLVKTLGFSSAATTQNALLNRNTDVMALPRLFLTERNGEDILNRLNYEC